jgi:hypothetical protein
MLMKYLDLVTGQELTVSGREGASVITTSLSSSARAVMGATNASLITTSPSRVRVNAA